MYKHSKMKGFLSQNVINIGKRNVYVFFNKKDASLLASQL